MRVFWLLCVLLAILGAQNLTLDSESSSLQQDLDALSGIRSAPNLDDSGFEGFITFKEYGKNLYENPRGIGCNKCHGASGEGAVIAKYSHKGVQKVLSAPNIKNIDKNSFEKTLSKRKNGVMPNYYLTENEIDAIYEYVSEQ